MCAAPRFSTGGGAAAPNPEGAPAAEPETVRARPALFSFLLDISKPVLAAINGTVAGGGFVLAMMCDMRFMAETATISTIFAKRGLIATDPAADLPAVTIPTAAARPAPTEVIRKTFCRADQTGDPRDRLMVQLALLCGLRVHEVAKVHVRDVEGDELRVDGKAGRSRLVPMPPAVRLALRGRGGYLFPGRDDGHLSASYVQKKINALMPDGWTPHALRHAAAEAIYENSGCDLFATQEFLGHSKPETTRRYVPVKRQRLRAAVMEAAKAWSDADAG